MPVEDEAEALPKVSYDTVKLKRLKEMLQEFDLPVAGEKDVLVYRHERYVIRAEMLVLSLVADSRFDTQLGSHLQCQS